MFPRRGFAILVVTSVFVSLLSIQANASSIKLGLACPKRGIITQVGEKWFICGLNSRLVWSSGTYLVTTAVTPAPKTTITPGKANPASAITHAPTSMDGINTEKNWVDGGLDPAIVTLGPTKSTDASGKMNWYPDKIGMNFIIGYGKPVLAPIDGKFIGFNNRNSKYRNADALGPLRQPFDDLEVCFESSSLDWPKLLFCFYHLQNSPLLRGLDKTPLCGRAEAWPGPMRALGRQIYAANESTISANEAGNACEGLMGKMVKRGEVIAYAGTVGDHSQAPMKIQVSDSKKNPNAKNGDSNLHWVQPDAFFYWKCYSPSAKFESGVMAYPFECGGYQVPTEQRSTTFKYSSVNSQ